MTGVNVRRFKPEDKPADLRQWDEERAAKLAASPYVMPTPRPEFGRRLPPPAKADAAPPPAPKELPPVGKPGFPF